MKLASGGVMPLPELLAAGVKVALGTDGASSNNSLDMMHEMKSARCFKNPTAGTPRRACTCDDSDGVHGQQRPGFHGFERRPNATTP